MTIRSFVSRNRVALHNYVERDKLRPIVVMSPHPPEECVRRLAKVTTVRKSGWYLDWRTATLPDPLFHGEVGAARNPGRAFRRGGQQRRSPRVA